MLLLNALFAAITAWTMCTADERILGRVGVIAAWIWALSPYAVLMSIKVWETSLSAMLVTLGALLYWKLRISDEPREWALWDLFWGMAALVIPNLGVGYTSGKTATLPPARSTQGPHVRYPAT